MLLGVVLPRVASPPVIEKIKSSVSRAPAEIPVPLLKEEYASSLNVTSMVVLYGASVVVAIVSGTFLLRVTVLLDCTALAALPLAS